MKKTIFKVCNRFTTIGNADTYEDAVKMYNRLRDYISEVEEDDEDKVVICEMVIEQSEELDRWYGVGSYKVLDYIAEYEV